jgi:tRNA (adenine37-N6)-methyltransferase
LDIKPYVPYVDSVAEASNPVAAEPPRLIKVHVPDSLQHFCREYTSITQLPLLDLIEEVLQQNPKPAYQEPDPHRVYGMKLYDLDVRWRYFSSSEILLDSILRADT